jgi:glutathione S-transferase
MTLKLWGRPTSGRTQKVLWTLAEIGLDFELILASGVMGPGGHISKGNDPYGIVDTSDYRAMNPNGRVPTIDDDGFVLLGIEFDRALSRNAVRTRIAVRQ